MQDIPAAISEFDFKRGRPIKRHFVSTEKPSKFPVVIAHCDYELQFLIVS